MKKLVWLIAILMLLSLACQALLPATMVPASSPTSPPQPLTCTDDTCLETCLQRIEAALPPTEYEPLTGAYAENNVSLDLVYYDVNDGQLGEPQFLQVPDSFKQFQQDIPAHQKIWRYASSLLPLEELKWVNRFEIYKSGGGYAWVRPNGRDREDRSHWILGVELVNAQDPIEITYTLVHEYAHLISLNTDQIPASEYYFTWSQNPTFCKQFLMPIGCTTPDSYLNLFYQKFWKDILEYWQETVDRPAANVKNQEEFWALKEKFYNRHSTSFVDAYAATNIQEDFAETFMYFVLEPKPNGTSTREKKIQFFYEFPELVSLRQQVIQNLCSYTGK